MEIFLRTEPFKCASSVFLFFSPSQTLFLLCCFLSSLASKYAWPQCLQALKYKSLYKSLFDITQLLIVSEASLYHFAVGIKDHNWNQWKISLNVSWSETSTFCPAMINTHIQNSCRTLRDALKDTQRKYIFSKLI